MCMIFFFRKVLVLLSEQFWLFNGQVEDATVGDIYVHESNIHLSRILSVHRKYNIHRHISEKNHIEIKEIFTSLSFNYRI